MQHTLLGTRKLITNKNLSVNHCKCETLDAFTQEP